MGGQLHSIAVGPGQVGALLGSVRHETGALTRPRALVLAPFSEAGIERLADRVDVGYESWMDSGRLHDPDELAAKLNETGCVHPRD